MNAPNPEPTVHPVHKALHRPLTIGGIDRRVFFLSLLMGAATFNLLYSFLAGVLVFVALYAFGVWSTRRDPQMLTILFSSSRFRRRYDPAKYTSRQERGVLFTVGTRLSSERRLS